MISLSDSFTAQQILKEAITDPGGTIQNPETVVWIQSDSCSLVSSHLVSLSAHLILKTQNSTTLLDTFAL